MTPVFSNSRSRLGTRKIISGHKFSKLKGKKTANSNVQGNRLKFGIFFPLPDPDFSRKIEGTSACRVHRRMRSESVVICLFCGKWLRYKSIILSERERIMPLKIRVAVTVFR